MIRQRIYVARYGWEVTVYYDSRSWDAGEILGELDEAGVDDETYYRAAHNLMAGVENTGLTYSDLRHGFSVIVLSHTSSKAEFASTWYHEVKHCAEHIAEAYGIPLEGEPTAYIGGELARSMQPVAARLMCPTCEREAA